MSGTARQRRLEAAQASGRLPGVVAAAFDLDGITWSGTAGDATDVAGQYRIGSITKTLTAVLVMMCRDQGLWSLDDPIGRFVPETGYCSATLRQLLSHTSGMQSEPSGPWWERAGRGSFAELVAADDGGAAVAPAGAAYHYSNLAYALLGEATVRAQGTQWWALVQERLLQPLGMSRTTYHPAPGARPGFSVRHFTGELDPEPSPDTGAMAPAGQLWSTLDDLARWGAFLVDGHPDVLARASLDEMSTPVTPEYGLGLRLTGRDGGGLVGHTGSMPGFLAAVFVDRRSGRGAAVLTNATTGIDTDVLARDLVEERETARAEPWVPTVRVPPEVSDLPGVWFWGNSAFDVRWSNDRLELHDMARHELSDRFSLVDGRLVGDFGYHLGEQLHVVRHEDGAPSHLEAATFVYTRTPYDARAPIPGSAGDAPRA